MANYVEAYEDSIDKIYAEYAEKTTDDNLEHEAYQRLLKTKYNYHDPDQKKRLMDAEKQQLKLEHYNATARQIDHEQALLRKAYESDEVKIERDRMRASSGLTLAEQYAKKHGIDVNSAKMELDAYAETRVGNYSDSLPDRYSLLRNRSRLKGNDVSFAYMHEQQEFKKLGIGDTVNRIKSAQYYANQNPGNVLRDWNSSGAVMSRQLRRGSGSTDTE